jgi:hypothetical protein
VWLHDFFGGIIVVADPNGATPLFSLFLPESASLQYPRLAEIFK